MIDELLSSREVAKEFSVSARTIWRWLRLGLVPQPIHLGGLTRWRRRDIRKHIRRLAKLTK